MRRCFNTGLVCFVSGLFIIVLLFSCGNNSKASQKEKDAQLRPNPVHDTCMVYFEKGINKYTCCMLDLKTKDTIQIAHFTNLPFDVLWDTNIKVLYFLTDEGVFKGRYDSVSAPVKIAKALEEKIFFEEAWIDSISNNIRYSFLVSSDNFSNAQKSFYEKLEADEGVNLPEDGIECIVYVSEIDNNGSVIVLDTYASKTAAGFFMPFNVVDRKLKSKKPGIVSLRNLISASTCIEQSRLDQVSWIESESFERYGISKYQIDEQDGFKLIRTGTPFDIIVKISFGDSPHYAPPIFVYNGITEKTSEIEKLSQSQFGISVLGNYVLFAGEYDNSAPTVYNWKNQKIIVDLPEATFSVLF